MDTPRSTPLDALNWDTGAWPIEERITVKKLTFLHHIMNLNNASLAKEILRTQNNYKFPGLFKETKKLLDDLNLPNITEDDVANQWSKLKWKNLVKKAVKEMCEKRLKLSIKGFNKTKDGPMVAESFHKKDYMNIMTLNETRIKFKMRSHMFDVKWNYKSDPTKY